MPLPLFTRRAALLAGVCPALLAACGKPPTPSFNGVDLTGAVYARDFELLDPEGRTRRLADFRGKVPVIFFGYTQCPDVCPTTMGELRAVKAELGEVGKEVVPIFISVDPKRDTPAVLRDYAAAFGPDVLALTGSEAQIEVLKKEFRVIANPVPGSGGGYTVDHTAASFLFDRQGRVRVYVRYGTPPAALLADLKTLLAEKS
jgi:protein SCO1